MSLRDSTRLKASPLEGRSFTAAHDGPFVVGHDRLVVELDDTIRRRDDR